MSSKNRGWILLLLWMVGGGLLWSAGACKSRAPAGDEIGSEKEEELQVYRRAQPMMGTGFEIQVVSADAHVASRALDAAFAEIDRVEELISEWRETSEISEVNREAGQRPVAVGPELFEVVQRGQEIAGWTGGAFDITFAGCNHLWSVRAEKIPDEHEIEKCLPRIDYEAVILDGDNQTIAFEKTATRIGVGGIGKGYGVDRAAQVLRKKGIDHFVVDGGGDLRVQGRRIDRPWSVGVANPRMPAELLGTVTLESGAVVTSGDYERYFERDGKRYHHIIDPATGRPARSSMAVTVVAEDATTADAVATGLFVLGPQEGIELADQLDGVQALIVGPDGTIHRSREMDRFFRAPSPRSSNPVGEYR